MQIFSGTVLSIAFFNFAGITVTKESSATTRMVLDSVRTIVIWAFSMILLTQKFHWLQVKILSTEGNLKKFLATFLFSYWDLLP